MEKKLELKNYDSKKELKEEIRKTKDGRYELKLRVTLMVKEEYSPTEKMVPFGRRVPLIFPLFT